MNETSRKAGFLDEDCYYTTNVCGFCGYTMKIIKARISIYTAFSFPSIYGARAVLQPRCRSQLKELYIEVQTV